MNRNNKIILIILALLSGASFKLLSIKSDIAAIVGIAILAGAAAYVLYLTIKISKEQ